MRIDLSVSRTVKVTGINSNIDTDNNEHILLWDFDETCLSDVIQSLKTVQETHTLPTIHIVQSSFEHLHAYCFCKFTTQMASYIISTTEYVDKIFWKLGVVRGYWTLRFTPKNKSTKFTHVCDLSSNILEDMSVLQNLDVVKYITGV